MLEKEQSFYDENKEKFRKLYLGKIIVISENDIKGIFESDEEAFDFSLQTMTPGTFMIKKVTSTDEEAIQRFTSRVYV